MELTERQTHEVTVQVGKDGSTGEQRAWEGRRWDLGSQGSWASSDNKQLNALLLTVCSELTFTHWFMDSHVM